MLLHPEQSLFLVKQANLESSVLFDGRSSQKAICAEAVLNLDIQYASI
jgi:hypothetical protein